MPWMNTLIEQVSQKVFNVDAGMREKDVIRRSIERLPLYSELDTYWIDVSEIGPDEAASLIMSMN